MLDLVLGLLVLVVIILICLVADLHHRNVKLRQKLNASVVHDGEIVVTEDDDKKTIQFAFYEDNIEVLDQQPVVIFDVRRVDVAD